MRTALVTRRNGKVKNAVWPVYNKYLKVRLDSLKNTHTTEKQNFKPPVWLYYNKHIVEWFSIDRHKTRTKVITLGSHNRLKQCNEQFKNTCNRRQAQEPIVSKSRLVLVLLLSGRQSGVSFSNQPQSVVKQMNAKQSRISFDTQLKPALRSELQHGG